MKLKVTEIKKGGKRANFSHNRPLARDHVLEERISSIMERAGHIVFVAKKSNIEGITQARLLIKAAKIYEYCIKKMGSEPFYCNLYLTEQCRAYAAEAYEQAAEKADVLNDPLALSCLKKAILMMKERVKHERSTLFASQYYEKICGLRKKAATLVSDSEERTLLLKEASESSKLASDGRIEYRHIPRQRGPDYC